MGEVDHDMVAHRPESDLSICWQTSWCGLHAIIMRRLTLVFTIWVVSVQPFLRVRLPFGDVLDIAPFENKIAS